MRFETEPIGHALLIHTVTATLDASNSAEFKLDIGPLIASNTRIIFDLSSLNFIDSSGVGALLSCLRRISGLKGELKIVGVQPRVRSVFQLLRMHQIFDLVDNAETAVTRFSSP